MTVLRKLFIGLSVITICGISYAEDIESLRVLFSGGGEWHPYGECSGAMIDSLRVKGGFLCSYSEDPQSLKFDHLKNFDVLVIFNGVFYAGDDQKQKEPTPDYIPGSITQFVQSGGGLIVIHSGVASFSDWKEYIDLIGGIWVWGTSKHDSYNLLKSKVVADHPIVTDIPNTFEFPDEFYHTLKIQPSVKVLVESTHLKDGQTVTEPLVWVAKETEKERVAVILHGHDMGSWGTPIMQQLMRQAIEWAGQK